MCHFESQPVNGARNLHLQGETQQLQGSLWEEGVSQHHGDQYKLVGKC